MELIVKVSGFSGFQIDVESDFVFFCDELNHSTVERKAGRIAHREDVPALQGSHDLCQSVILRSANEQDLTSLDVIKSAIALDNQGTVVHLLVTYCFIQTASGTDRLRRHQ